MNSHEWFGVLMTLMYAVFLPLLVITAGAWAAQVDGQRGSGHARRTADGVRDRESR